MKWAEYGGSGAAASLQAGGLFEAGLCLQGNLGLRAWRRAGMKGKRKFLQEGLKSCELGGWEWRWSYRDLVLADMAFWLFQRSSVGYWSVALGWEFRGVWGVKVPVLSVWTCTWSGPAFHLVLVPVASSCCLQEHGRAGPLPRHRKSPAIPQSLRGSGTNCPPCCDLRTTKRREVYRNWGAFSM